MRWWKAVGLHLYQRLTENARHKEAIMRESAGQVPVMVLFYHRIADTQPNDWTMDTKTFATQMRWLKNRYDIVSLEEAQKRIASKENRWPTVAITFDDGYADNCEFALPFLLREEIPFTYFVTTENLFEQLPFPHDVEIGQKLAPNTPEQIRSLANAGVQIGAHTRTHADLGRIEDSVQLGNEIVGSKEELEKLINHKVRYFAFPFGQHTNMTQKGFQIAYEAGFEGVCSAYGGYNFPGADAFHLQRIHADPEWVRFRNWMSVDPRKLKSISCFDPGNYKVSSTNVEPLATDNTFATN